MNRETSPYKQLHSHVAQQMRKAILDGQYRPGEWLRQERLAQELGVSQMPVREALKQLTSEGLIEHVPYRGARVISFSIDDIHDLYEHRAFLEGRAAFYAATAMVTEEIGRIRGIQMEIAGTKSPEDIARYRELNREFHQAIYSGSRREYLIRTLNTMWAAFPTMLLANYPATASAPLPERDPFDDEEHQAVIRALEARKPVQAEEAMRSHIQAAAGHLIKFLKTGPGS